MPSTMTTQSLKNAFQSGIRLNRQSERDGDRVIVASGNTSRNRDYETGKAYRIIPAGSRLQAWRSNPLVLWHHNFQIPIGKADMYLENGMLWADKLQFHRQVIPIATQNWIGDAIGEFNTAVIADLWLGKWLNATSIHVMFAQEDEANVIETDNEIIFGTSEMLEFSLVTIPGDRDSVRQKMESLGVPGKVATAMVGDHPLHIWKQEQIDLGRYKKAGDMPVTTKEKAIMARKSQPVQPVAEELEDEIEEVDPLEIAESSDDDTEDGPEIDLAGEIELDIELVAEATIQAISQSPVLLDALAQNLADRVVMKILPQLAQAQSATPRKISLVFKGSQVKPQANKPVARPQQPITQSISGGPAPTENSKYVQKPTRFVKHRGVK